jgi:gliding motility-associated-like protein
MHFLKRILVLSQVLQALTAAGQKENSTWYYGLGLGLKFDGTNVSQLPTGKNFAAYWGSSTVSDPVTGQLLFYTDGHDVYDADHSVMNNGQNLVNTTTVVEIISMPHPGQKGVYFIFTTTFDNKLCYAMLDMSANNGRGAITTKNQAVKESVYNHFAVVRQAYSQGYWLIAHAASTGADSNTFFAFRITEDGLDMKYVETQSGFGVSPDTYMDGEMTSTTDGKKLFFSFHEKAGLFEFDKVCGKVNLLTDFEKFSSPGILYTGGAFSLDGRKLFATRAFQDGMSMLIWYDLTQQPQNMFVGTVALSPSLFDKNGSYFALELAPDGRIYITTAENGAVSGKLHVIHYPDKDPINWKLEHWFIKPPQSNIYYTEGLPSLIQDRSNPEANMPDFDITNGCTGEKAMAALKSNLDTDSLLWNFGDPLSGTVNFSREKNPSHTYTKGGEYTVTFSWYRCGYGHSVSKTVRIAEKPQSALKEKLIICPGATELISAGGDPSASFLWSTGATDSAIHVSIPGIYSVIISKGNCSITDSILVEQYPDIWVRLGREYFICEDENELHLLDAGKGFERYLWFPTGDTTQWIKVAKTGGYYVIVEDFNGCSGSAGTVVRRRCPQYLYFPNAFTPNNDGINDIFKPEEQDILAYSMSLYNRWGQKVFETNNINQGWDGKIKGAPAPAGVYFWKARYIGYDKSKHLRPTYLNGTVTLLK